MERMLVELVAALRSVGLPISGAETLDAARALAVVGVSRRDDVIAALRAAILRGQADAARFELALSRFFERQGARERGLGERLREAGFAEWEIDALAAMVAELAGGAAQVLTAVMAGEATLDRLLDQAVAQLAPHLSSDPARTGFATMRALDAAELPRARTQLEALRSPLRDALGARGLELADALERELSGLHGAVRQKIEAQGEPIDAGGLRGRPFAHLTPEELERMRLLVERLAQQVLQSERVRRRHAHEGRLDGRATLRRAAGTLGVPARPVFHRAGRRPGRLTVLCDISESVRATARLSLTFVHAIQRIFAETRSYVFVSDVGDATSLFDARPVSEAIARAYQGEVVGVSDNSNYGRALARFDALLSSRPDPRGTLLVIGDARTNHFAPGEAALARLRRRVDRLVWFNPQPRASWYEGDSAMGLYERHADACHPTHDFRAFEVAVRALVRLGRRPGRASGSC